MFCNISGFTRYVILFVQIIIKFLFNVFLIFNKLLFTNLVRLSCVILKKWRMSEFLYLQPYEIFKQENFVWRWNFNIMFSFSCKPIVSVYSQFYLPFLLLKAILSCSLCFIKFLLLFTISSINLFLRFLLYLIILYLSIWVALLGILMLMLIKL